MLLIYFLLFSGIFFNPVCLENILNYFVTNNLYFLNVGLRTTDITDSNFLNGLFLVKFKNIDKNKITLK